MQSNKIFAVTLAAVLALTMVGNVAAVTPDTADCTDAQSNPVSNGELGLMDDTDDSGGGGDGDFGDTCYYWEDCYTSPPAQGGC